jgi:accessory colonization factor AcfC
MAQFLTEEGLFCTFSGLAMCAHQFLRRLLHGLNVRRSHDLIKPGVSFSQSQGDRDKRADQTVLWGTIASDFRVREKVAKLYFAWRSAIYCYLLQSKKAITAS